MKSRSKALKITVRISGVKSAALSGAEKDQLVVVGENIDAVELARQLRKGIGYTELVSFSEDKEDKPAAVAQAPASSPAVPSAWLPCPALPIHIFAAAFAFRVSSLLCSTQTL